MSKYSEFNSEPYICQLSFLYDFGLTVPLVATEHLEFVVRKFVGSEEGFCRGFLSTAFLPSVLNNLSLKLQGVAINVAYSPQTPEFNLRKFGVILRR